MNGLRLALPTPADEQKVWAYREEFLNHVSSMDGTGGLAEAQSFEQWYSRNLANRCEQTVQPGFVPATTFLALDEETDELIGMIDIRHYLNSALLKHGGHIGYSVRPTCRGRGYATEMLALALKQCRTLGLHRVLVTCNRTNLASAKVIVHNGGVLENELENGGIVTQRYWISLSDQ